MSLVNYESATRIQYTFAIKNKSVATLFAEMINPDKIPVNIVGLVVTHIDDKSDSKCNLVKIVVGTDDPNNPKRGGSNKSFSHTNEVQNQRFIEILKGFKIKYTTSSIIQIFNPQVSTGTPGTFRLLYTALLCAKINVLSAYLAEPALIFPIVNYGNTQIPQSNISSFFYEVKTKDLDKAIKVVKHLNVSIPFDESQLCINKNNIPKKFKADNCDLNSSSSDSD